MRRASTIEKETLQIMTIQDLTGVFESLASTQVAKVKNRDQLSKDFFRMLWSRYSSIRVEPGARITEREGANDRQVFIVISAEAGLTGDIDDRLIETMRQDYKAGSTDVIVLGTHGATLLSQHDIPFIRYFQVPETDMYIDVSPVIDAVLPYSSIRVYYEEYVSLGVQGIKIIDLMSTIRDMSEEAGEDEDVITADDTIFEPSLDEIADQMEMTMMTLALEQAILDSSLAQSASRFNAMAVAKKRAGELITDYRLEFHRAKRSESDRRMREVMVSLKKKKRRLAGKGR